MSKQIRQIKLCVCLCLCARAFACLSVRLFAICLLFVCLFVFSEGIMIFPPSTADYPWEKYEGQWEDGNLGGYGKMRYTTDYLYTFIL